jgi:hypothetical protein
MNHRAGFPPSAPYPPLGEIPQHPISNKINRPILANDLPYSSLVTQVSQ